MIKKLIQLFLFMLLTHSVVNSQDTLVLTMDGFLNIVDQNHPIARRVTLLNNNNKWLEVFGKSAFDPQLKANRQQKVFDQKNYYDHTKAQISIPTITGISVNGAYKDADGEFLNRSDFLPQQGLYELNFAIPIGSGLRYDERRQQLEQSRVLVKLNKNKQLSILNELYAEAMSAYLQWQTLYAQNEILKTYLTIAGNQLLNTVDYYQQGTIPAIDTLEASLNVTTVRDLLLNNEKELLKAKYEISNFLWDQNYVPYQLNSNVVPQNLTDNILDTVLQVVISNLDILLNQNTKIAELSLGKEQLETDQKLNLENIKPRVDLQYARLFVPVQNIDFSLPDNYQWSLNFSYPLLNRKARSKVALTDIKIGELELIKEQTKNQLRNSLSTLIENQDIMIQQLQVISQGNTDMTAIANAELEKFALGESSIFLVNSRIAKQIEWNLKEITTISKLIKNRINLLKESQLMVLL